MDNMGMQLNILKQFEASIRRILLQKYGQYLPEDRVTLLNNSSFVTEELLKGTNDLAEMQGTIIRENLDLLIDMETTKDMKLENGEIVNVPFGKDIEDGLIEFYTNKLAKEYDIDINNIPQLKENLAFVTALDKKLNGTMNTKAFSGDAVKLLDSEELKDIVVKYDEYELKKYLDRVNVIAGDNPDKKEENETVKQNVEREDSLQIVWIDDRKNVKYIDEDGKVHLVDIEDSQKAQEYFEKKFVNLAPGEKLNQEEFFRELKKIAEETKLQKTEDVKTEDLNYEEMDMLAFVEANKDIHKQEEKDIVTHSDDMKIHVTEANDNIISTSDEYGYVEAHEIKNGNAEMDEDRMQGDTNISSRLITREEYANLWERFYNGEELTHEELEQLRRAYVHYAQEEERTEEKEEEMKKESPMVLKQNSSTNWGFTDTLLPLYISIILVLAITVFIIYILAK